MKRKNKVFAKIVRVEPEILHMDNGWTVESYHPQDCCESHWLDFPPAADELIGETLNLSDEFFQRVPGYGIKLCVEGGHPIPIAGYGSNNGYYGDAIFIQVRDEKGEMVEEYDVSRCQRDYYTKDD